MTSMIERQKDAKRVTVIGMIINFFLVIFKYTLGFLGNSAALVADATHSLSDFISDIAVLIGFRYTAKPADDKHNYGHGKIETITAVLIGMLLVFLSYLLFKQSIINIYDFFVKGVRIKLPKLYVLYAVIASIVLKEILFQITIIVGKRIDSEAVIANAWHHRSDAFSSVAAFVGIGLALLLGENFAILDPITSFVVSIFIIKVGFDIILSSYKQLIDTSLSDDEVKKIENIIMNVEGIRGYHNIKTRKIGFYISIDVHIFVDKYLNVEEAHNIASELEHNIYNEYGKETFISVHVEPYYEKYPLKE